METNKIKCRKCGGNHLTIKCPENKTIVDLKNISDKNNSGKSNTTSARNNISARSNISNISNISNKNDININDKNDIKYKVKISNLPSNISNAEIFQFIKDWGIGVRVNVKNFDNNSYAIVDFRYQDEQEYFIRAMDSTPFDNVMLSVVALDNIKQP